MRNSIMGNVVPLDNTVRLQMEGWSFKIQGAKNTIQILSPYLFAGCYSTIINKELNFAIYTTFTTLLRQHCIALCF